MVQHLLDRGLGAAGVAIDPAPTSGVLVGLQTILSTLPVFGTWGSWRMVMTMSRRFLPQRFAQTAARTRLTPCTTATSSHAWQSLLDGITNAAGKINWSNPKRPPLLLIGGG